MEKCPKCANLVIPGAAFCSNCGTNLVQSKNWIPCPSCLKIINRTDSFCPWCGKGITNVDNLGFVPPEMIFIEGGSFVMSKGESAHQVNLSAFKISKAPVTQELYEAVMKINPSKIKKANHPVESVNWCEAVIFCNELSNLLKLEPCYSLDNHTNLDGFDYSSQIWNRLECNLNANGFRLPTEAEWEYVARGGKFSAPFLYSGSHEINDVAWYGENSDISTHEVCKKKPNNLGIYDMCGNVAEWTFDKFQKLPIVQQTNPTGPSYLDTTANHVKRGGSWLDDKEQCTVYFRSASVRTGKSSSLGFRLCAKAAKKI